MAEKPPVSETQFISLTEIQKELELKKSGNYFTFTVIEGSDFGYVFSVEETDLVVGRKVDDEDFDDVADIQLNDEKASRRHVLITKTQMPDKFFSIFISDLRSKNGTYINDKRVTSPISLCSGDKISIGNTVLKFEIKEELGIPFQERLFRQATRDALTDLWTQKYMDNEIDKAVIQGTRHGLSFSIMLMEVDFFQDISTRYGKKIGNDVLRQIAKLIPEPIPNTSVISRYKDNQFLIMIPDLTAKEITENAETIRQEIENYDFSSIGCSQRITVSIGIVQFPECGRTAEIILKKADEAIYLAKQSGNNRVVVSSIPRVNTIPWGKIAKVALVLLIFISIVTGGYFYAQQKPKEDKTLVFSGVVEVNEIKVGSKVAGRVKEVFVHEGDKVKSSQVMVSFDIDELLTQRKQLEARVEQAQAYLDKLLNGNRKEEIEQAKAIADRELAVLTQLRNGPRPQEITQLKAEIIGAESELANAELTYKRLSDVFSTGYIAKQDKDDAENRVNLARAKVNSLKEKLVILELGTRQEEIMAAQERYNQAQANLRLLNAGARQEDIADARARLKEIQASIENLDVKIREGEIKAPNDSSVEVINIRPGDLIASGTTVATLLEDDQLWVRAYVPETQLGYVRLNQKAFVTIDTFPNRKLVGYVKDINKDGEFIPRNLQSRDEREHQVFGIKVYLDKEEKNFLKSGMSADVILEK
jgi:diguanylate cyclase (GGDEF)-like protein